LLDTVQIKHLVACYFTRPLSSFGPSLAHSLQRRRRFVAHILHRRDGRQFHALRILSRCRRSDLPANAVQATLRATGSFPFLRSVSFTYKNATHASNFPRFVYLLPFHAQ